MDAQHLKFNSRRITCNYPHRTVAVIQVIHLMIFTNDWKKTKYTQLLIPSPTTRLRGDFEVLLIKLNEVEGLNEVKKYTHNYAESQGGRLLVSLTLFYSTALLVGWSKRAASLLCFNIYFTQASVLRWILAFCLESQTKHDDWRDWQLLGRSCGQPPLYRQPVKWVVAVARMKHLHWKNIKQHFQHIAGHNGQIQWF